MQKAQVKAKIQKASNNLKKAVDRGIIATSDIDTLVIEAIRINAVSRGAPVRIYDPTARNRLIRNAPGSLLVPTILTQPTIEGKMSVGKKSNSKNEFLEERLEAIWTPHMTSESPELTKSIAKNLKANMEKHRDYYASLKTNPRKP